MIEGPKDFAIFFDPRDFGRRGTYAGGEPGRTVEIAGIFANAHVETAGADNWPGVSTTAPTFTVAAADLPAGSGDGDTLTLAGTTYTVRDVQPDGTGVARLILERN